jgi:uncharacterized protein|tara:strand:+ start:492 stop:1763 length:1272 start_codon:yes stop_codon:yes gene_type:complete
LQPIDETNRIESLDVIRGFALLGILLLNILGFGLHSASYPNPGFDLSAGSGLDLFTYATVELFAEGAMRCLFSMLFGAGVVLFTTGARAKSGSLHYKRTLGLLTFGLIDAYLLLWNGDILVTYALAGALLYWVRNISVRSLIIMAGVLILIMSGFYGLIRLALGEAYKASEIVMQAENPDSLDQGVLLGAEQWTEFVKDYKPTDEAIAGELSARRESYLSAFSWNAKKTNMMLSVNLPMIIIWDALAMMLLGMAFYKAGIFQGEKAAGFYIKLMLAGFSTGLLVNGYEVSGAITSEFDLFSIFAQMQPTYHIGRLGMAIGYIGLLVWLTHRDVLTPLRGWLASVGRMALTNYLMHSIICALIFTGTGLALVGELNRASLYPIVIGIWFFQLWFSQFWLKRYRFGPVEWLWRASTYGERPAFKR